MKRRFDPAGPLRGSVRAAADKSLSHRAPSASTAASVELVSAASW